MGLRVSICNMGAPKILPEDFQGELSLESQYRFPLLSNKGPILCIPFQFMMFYYTGNIFGYFNKEIESILLRLIAFSQ